MRSLAILCDSFRETLDCKTLWILFVVSSVLILLSFSLSFDALTPEEALADIAGGFDTLARGRSRVKHEVAFQVDEAKEDGKAGYSFRLRATPAIRFHRMVREWDAIVRGEAKGQREILAVDKPADEDLQRQYLVARFRSQQLLRVSVEPEAAEGQSLVWRVAVRPERPELLHGAHRMGVLFGVFRTRLATSVAMTLSGLEYMLAEWLAGFAGLIFAVVVTGSFVPDMLQKGRIDLLLSRPMGRASLLLHKYLGGLLYVLLSAVYLVGGCWLGLAVRAGIWDPSFLLTIPVLTFLFAVLYGFAVWIGVLTRNALVAILCTIALWFASFSAGSFQARLRISTAPSPFPAAFEKVVEVCSYLLPKTFDLQALNTGAIIRSHLGVEAAATVPPANLADPSSWPMVVGSSVVILAAFLACACLTFSRRDY